MNELMTTNPAALTHAADNTLSVAALQQRAAAVRKMLTSHLVDGVHYYAFTSSGALAKPGDNSAGRPSLNKAGAEQAMLLFGIRAFPNVEIIREGDDYTYRVTCEMRSSNGESLGFGVGEASTEEEKYAWRGAACQEEWDDADPHKRRKKYKKKWDERARAYGKPEIVLQVRENSADKRNTVLKMAKKRAMIDACLTVLGISDMFTQDIDPEDDDDRAKIAQPEPAPKREETAMEKLQEQLASYCNGNIKTVQRVLGIISGGSVLALGEIKSEDDATALLARLEKYKAENPQAIGGDAKTTKQNLKLEG